MTLDEYFKKTAEQFDGIDAVIAELTAKQGKTVAAAQGVQDDYTLNGIKKAASLENEASITEKALMRATEKRLEMDGEYFRTISNTLSPIVTEMQREIKEKHEDKRQAIVDAMARVLELHKAYLSAVTDDYQALAVEVSPLGRYIKTPNLKNQFNSIVSRLHYIPNYYWDDCRKAANGSDVSPSFVRGVIELIFQLRL